MKGDKEAGQWNGGFTNNYFNASFVKRCVDKKTEIDLSEIKDG